MTMLSLDESDGAGEERSDDEIAGSDSSDVVLPSM